MSGPTSDGGGRRIQSDTVTIGEVLNLLQDEFDDITISKIRFLESEGLIHPDRSESGYRQFTGSDVERLRYVLRAQRDRYLPLKVIKEELDRLDAGAPVELPPRPDPTGVLTASVLTPQAVPPDPARTEERELNAADAVDVQLSVNEFASATGLGPAQVQGLREHGLLRGDGIFDGEDLQVGRAAAALMRLGLEPRHLRMYRQFADRELALFEQLITPLLRQRNPDSRRAAMGQLDQLQDNGRRLQRSLLDRDLRSLLR